MTLGWKFLVWKNRNVSFQKISFQICIFNCNKCILVRLYGKGACIKKNGVVKNYNTNPIMEKKNKQRGRGGGVKDMEYSKYKDISEVLKK